MARSQEDILEDILNTLRDSGSGATRSAGSSGNSAGSSSTGGGRSIDSMIAESQAAADSLRKMTGTVKLLPKSIKEFNSAIYDNQRQLRRLEEEMEKVANGTSNLNNAQIRQVKAAYEEAKSRDGAIESANNFQSGLTRVSGVVKGIGSQLISSALNIASTIQSGASGFGIAGAVFEAQADLQNTAMQGVATAGTMAGGAMMMAGGKAKYFGAAVGIASTALGVLSDLGTQYMKGANRIIVSEGEKLLQSWKQATSAGAILARGADDMRSSLAGSKYTLQDYSEMVKNNSEALAGANMGVGQASMMFGKVNKILGPTSMALVALGIDLKDQGAVIAQVMADMRRRDPNAVLNERTVAERTKQYAIDLATLTSITGQNAKALMEQSRAQTSQLAFQQFLQTLGPDAAASVEKSMASLTPAMRSNVMDIVNYGSVINKNGAIMRSLNPALAAMEDQIAAQVKAGTANDASIQAIQAQNRASVNAGSSALKDFALAAAAPDSALAGMAQEFVTARDHLNKMGTAVAQRETAELRYAESLKGVTGEKPDSDYLGKLFLQAEQAGIDLRVALQDSIIKKLPGYGDIITAAIKHIQEMIANAPDPTKMLETQRDWLTIGAGVIGGLLAVAQIASLVKGFRGGPKPPPSLPPGPGGKPPGAGGADGPKPGNATPTTSTGPQSKMTPAQLEEYNRLRGQNVPASEARTRAIETKPAGGVKQLSQAEARIAQQASKEAADAAAKKAAEEAAAATAKAVAKEGGEGFGKMLLKKIPLLGLGAGLIFGAQRAIAGDYTGAAMEVGSGAASIVPGYGTAASVGIDAALMARDVNRAMNPEATTARPAPAGAPNRAEVAPKPAPPPAPPVVPGTPLSDASPQMKALTSSLASASTKGVGDGFKQNMPAFSNTLVDRMSFAVNAAVNPAKDLVSSTMSANNATIALAKSIVEKPTDKTESPELVALKAMSKSQGDQLSKLQQLVSQNESLIAFYNDQKTLLQAQLDVLGDSKSVHERILRSQA